MAHLSKTYPNHTKCPQCWQFIHDLGWNNHLERHNYQHLREVQRAKKHKELCIKLEQQLAVLNKS